MRRTIAMALLLLLVIVSVGLLSCGSTASAQQPQGLSLLKGKYTFWSTGQIWNQPGQDGKTSLPGGISTQEAEILYDSGTFDADGNGFATQCCGGSWGTWSSPMACVHWTYQFGTSDSGTSLNPRMGLITSDVGDKATIACTETGKHCVMTSHGVGWAWTQILDRE